MKQSELGPACKSRSYLYRVLNLSGNCYLPLLLCGAGERSVEWVMLIR